MCYFALGLEGARAIYDKRELSDDIHAAMAYLELLGHQEEHSEGHKSESLEYIFDSGAEERVVGSLEDCDSDDGEESALVLNPHPNTKRLSSIFENAVKYSKGLHHGELFAHFKFLIA